ncbi:hypothetical protein BJF78_02025 [Pseudonocardia sp. CNS-139]|nr:hypothetical protein BJF78_02025 [Pseudonocardia sp. CNS-139]
MTTPDPATDPAAVTRVLLAAAGLPVSDAEAAGFAAAYPALRAQAVTLYQPLWTEGADTGFGPAFGFSAAFPAGDAR